MARFYSCWLLLTGFFVYSRVLCQGNDHSDEGPGFVIERKGRWEEYESGVVNDNMEFLYTFHYKEYLNQTLAIRIHVHSPDATEEYPVTVVVQQQNQVISWEVPLVYENSSAWDTPVHGAHSADVYRSTNRTLCPLEDWYKTRDGQNKQMWIELSSFGPVNVSFALYVEQLTTFQLSLSEQYESVVSPSEPAVFEYTFPEGETGVVVKVESDTDHCMVVAIQNTECPVFDLTWNVKFGSTYQTITRKSAITLGRNNDKLSESFFIVLVVAPSDVDCFTEDRPQLDGYERRMKPVRITIEPRITNTVYLHAMLAAGLCIAVFYIVTIIVCLVYKYMMWERYQKQLLEEINEHPMMEPLAFESTIEPTEAASQSQASPTDVKIGLDTNQIPQPPKDVNSNKENKIHSMKLIEFTQTPPPDVKKKYRLYPWNMITIAIFYALPVMQLVAHYQKTLYETGDEDICYYNFYCAHPFRGLSAFNNVFSNVGYIFLGALFLAIVFRREYYMHQLLKSEPRLEQEFGIPQTYGIFYAAGMALIVEGVLSGCYHVCPSSNNFQFDTAFMYMMSWLLILKLHRSRHQDTNPQAHVAYLSIAVVIVISVFGVLEGTAGFWILFSVFYALSLIWITIKYYSGGRIQLSRQGFTQMWGWLKKIPTCECAGPIYKGRLVLIIVGNVINWALILYGAVNQPPDFASFLLYVFMGNLIIYFSFYIIMKLAMKEKLLLFPVICLLMAGAAWVVAAYFFFKYLANWAETPAVSREGNEECLLLNFFDSHDIWHFLSAISLFFSFLCLLGLDDDLMGTPRSDIAVF